MAEKNGKKKKIRFKGLLVIILFIYLVFSLIYCLWKMPINNIEITGNKYLKDNYIMSYLNLDNKSVMDISSKEIERELLKVDLISYAEVKKSILGKIYINIKEEKILFYNWNTKKFVLSNNKEISYNENYLGIPTLINYVPDKIYEKFIKKLNLVDKETLGLVSEIEYSPSEVNGKIIDENRFLFRMNDGNIVYINTVNIEKFNNYLEIYEVVVNKNGMIKGCLYLDSNSENKTFNNCETEKIVVEDGEEDVKNES